MHTEMELEAGPSAGFKMRTQMRIRGAIAMLALASIFASAHNCFGADSLESLRLKQTTLEQELESVKRRISALESTSVEQPSVQRAQSWFIKDFGIDDVNSAGGVEPYFVLFNPNVESAIKYVNIQVTLYNAVGDLISSDIGNKSTAGLSFTGPLRNADGEKRSDWGPVWYNSTGKCIRVISLQITFINGKVMSFAGNRVKNALAPGLTNECKLTKK